MNSHPFQLLWRSLRSRRWIVAMLLPMLLFAQFATATYLCPQVSQAVSQSAAMPLNCDMANADLDQPALCQAHCEANAQASGSSTDLGQSVLAFDSQPTWRLRSRTMRAFDVATPIAAPPPGGPPLYLLHMVLRD